MAAICGPLVNAQEKPASAVPAGALDLLFELGLPDTKAAKWVQAQGGIASSQLFDEDGWGGGGSDNAGNAWVLEDKKGELDLLMMDGSRVKAVAMKDEGDAAPKGGLTPVMIKPADWKKDASAFVARLKKVMEKRKAGDEENDYRFQQAVTQSGPALLFLAHARRRGDHLTVTEGLPLVLALGGGPEPTLDSAIATLANQKMQSLAQDWQRGLDANAYAAAIDALVAQFSRGWDQRAAAQQLAQRLRKPEQAPAQDAEAKATAAFLLKLKPEEVAALPPRAAWLLPEIERAQGSRSQPNLRFMRGRRGPSMDEEGSDTPLPPEVGAFFAKRRLAARALANLLGDQRMLRALNESENRRQYSYSGDDLSEGLVERAYQMIARPKELGELCGELLTGVLPERLQYSVNEGADAKPGILAWLEKVSAMSDDDLAWEYLRGSDNVSDQQFQIGLSYLVDKGSAESRVKLDAVFLDPAVWARGSDELFGALEKHAKQRTGDADAFRDKLIATVKEGQEANRREQMRYNSGNQEYVKQMEKQSAAFVKKVEQAFKPVKLEDMLAELVSASEEDAMITLQTLGPAVEKANPLEAEAQLFRAASKTKVMAAKMGLLGYAAQRVGADPGKSEAVPTFDEETRTALLKLLQDETVVPPNQWGGTEGSVADATAATLLMPRWKADESAKMGQLGETAGQVMRAWMLERARAMAAGKPLPPIPDASRVPKEDAERLAQEIAAQPAAECGKLLLSKTPDQQVAVITHFRDLKTAWPESIRAAHLTITRVSVKGKPPFSTEWKGRVLDEKFSNELTQALETAATDGKPFSVYTQISSILGGVTLNVSENKRPVSMDEVSRTKMKLPASGPPPDAIMALAIHTRSRVQLAYPVWKDAAKTKAWRDETAREPAPADGEANGRGGRSDPVAVAKALKAVFDAEPETRGRAMIWWHASRIGNDSGTPDESENEED